MTEQPSMPRLNLPPVRLRARRNDGRVEIWEPLRGCWLVLTPEEWVRQHVINFLTSSCGIPARRIVCEYPVPLNGQPQRADIVAADDHGRPWLLVECKAADVTIDDGVLAQAVRYNSVLHARYMMITNGLRHFCFKCGEGECSPCEIGEIQIQIQKS